MKQRGTTIVLVATLVVGAGHGVGASGVGRPQPVKVQKQAPSKGIQGRLVLWKSNLRVPRLWSRKQALHETHAHPVADGFIMHLTGPTGPTGPAANTKAFLKGVARGPLHLVDHLKSGKTFATAVAATAALGVVVEAASLDVEMAAWFVKLATLGVRFRYAAPRVIQARGPERWRQVGLEVVGAVTIGLELFGIHVLHDHGGHEHEAGGMEHLAEGLGPILTAAGQGMLAFHDLFFMPFGHTHDHHEQAPQPTRPAEQTEPTKE